jgi:hypothetical protein
MGFLRTCWLYGVGLLLCLQQKNGGAIIISASNTVSP